MKFFSSLLVFAILHHKGSKDWELSERNFQEMLKTTVTDHVCPNAERSQRRSSDTDCFATFIHSSSFRPRTYQLQEIITTSLFVKNCVNAPTGILNTQSFLKTRSRISVRTHGSRTHCQWYRNLADRYPSFPLDHIDHHAALTFAIVFGAAIPEACYCLPCLCIVLSLPSTIIFLCPSAPKLAQ